MTTETATPETVRRPAPLTVDDGSPTAHISGFAHYPLRYCLTDETGNFRLATGSSVAALKDSPYRHHGGVRVVAEHIAPDGTRVVTEPWAGGNWSGMCGSTCWVLDPEDEIKKIEGVLAALGGKSPSAQTTPMEHNVACTQAWWIRGLRTREKDGWDGFRVECSQQMRHEGLCGVNDWFWDSRARTPIFKDAP